MKKLSDLLKGTEHELLAGDLSAEVVSVAYDSRDCSAGYLFFCIPGFSVDGHEFIAEAVARGASTIVVSRDSVDVPEGINVVKVADPRESMGKISNRFFNEPSKSLFLVGVTGTNGKTSIAYLVDKVLRQWGRKTGMLGTVENRVGDEILSVKRTTPESMDLHYLHSKMVGAGCSHAVMEVSSHAIALKRIAGCEYNAAIYTNLTQDHLDFHKDLEEYFEVKKELFTDYLAKDGTAIVNIDDARGAELAAALGDGVVTYGINSANAIVRATNVKYKASGISYRVESEKFGSFDIKSHLCGKFNIYNTLAMVAFALSHGIGADVICAALDEMKGVPGRFEKIEEGQKFTVVVDYAHSPDGLENVLGAAREICDGKLLVVFGAGGDRDSGKRPLMGAVAAKMADIAVVTSDNPRSEDPVEIIDRIVQGLQQGMVKIEMGRNFKYFTEVDRFSGIKKALELAGENDVVVIAGKGHENYQIFRDRTIHFDDREVARNILKEMA